MGYKKTEFDVRKEFLSFPHGVMSTTELFGKAF